jgi:hypothetical protein
MHGVLASSLWALRASDGFPDFSFMLANALVISSCEDILILLFFSLKNHPLRFQVRGMNYSDIFVLGCISMCFLCIYTLSVD